MKPTAQAIVWEFYGEAPPVAAARKAFSPMVKFWLHKSQIFLPRWRCSRAEFLRELWTHLTSGRPRSLALGGLHRSLGNTSSLWNSTLPRAPSARSGVQMNRRWHSWSRSPSAAVLKPFASISLKSNKRLTSSLHISKSNKTFPSK